MAGRTPGQTEISYLVSVTAHPEASVHFGYDYLRGLKVQFTFDGRPPVYLDYQPTAAGAGALAEYILEQVGRRFDPGPGHKD